MSARVDALVEQFAAANDAIIAFVASCDEALWRAPTLGERRPVNVVAHHVSEGGRVYPALLPAMLRGEPLAGILAGTDGDPDAAWAALHAFNAAHEAAQGDCTREAVLAALRDQGAVLGALITGLSDDDLDRAVAFPYRPGTITGEELIERLPIGHVRLHLADLEATRAAYRRRAATAAG